MKELARFFKALADEARLQILWLLFQHGELCVCELEQALGVGQSKVSRHLSTLRHAGLVSDRRAGTWSYYSIPPLDDALERALLDALRTHLGGGLRSEAAIEAMESRQAGRDLQARCPARAQGGARAEPGTMGPVSGSRTGGGRR